MQITPPFGYAAITPLTREHRVRLPAPGWVPPLLRTNAILPVSVGEFAAAGRDFPLAFMPEGGGYSPVLVLGLATGENLFAQDARWLAGTYLPAYLRRYPFCTATLRLDAEIRPEHLICVATDCLAADGEAIFAAEDADAASQQRWQNLQHLLAEFDADQVRTMQLCELLARFDLLEPFTVSFAPPQGERVSMSGLLRVAEQRLESLPEPALRELIKTGAMAAIYAHLLSLHQFGRLLDRRMAQTAPA